MVHTEFELEAMAVESTVSPTGHIERLKYYVIESKFARQPPNASAAGGTYRDIEYFRVGKSSGEVDARLLGVIQQLMMSNDFVCGHAQIETPR
jgi:hypothetical protein